MNLNKIFSLEMVLEERKSKFNGKIEVISDLFFGKRIKVGGITQSGGIVEDLWKKTLKKVKKEKLRIKNCLILGFGGGSAAKIVDTFWPGAKITGVEIDPDMIELGEKYLKFPKSKLFVTDAYQFVLKNKDKYDLVIVDIYKGKEYPKKFGNEKFLKKIGELLSSNGKCLINRLSLKKDKNKNDKFKSIVRKYFFPVEVFHPLINEIFILGKR